MRSPRILAAALAALLAHCLNGQSQQEAIVREGVSVSAEPADFALPELAAGRIWSVHAFLPEIPPPGASLSVALFDPSGMPTGKALHAGDPDMHFLFRPRVSGASTLRVLRVESAGPIIKAIEDATRAVPRDRRVAAPQSPRRPGRRAPSPAPPRGRRARRA
jgi:hypothetical protein